MNNAPLRKKSNHGNYVVKLARDNYKYPWGHNFSLHHYILSSFGGDSVCNTLL